jgi:hypothetical protein
MMIEAWSVRRYAGIAPIESTVMSVMASQRDWSPINGYPASPALPGPRWCVVDEFGVPRANSATTEKRDHHHIEATRTRREGLSGVPLGVAIDAQIGQVPCDRRVPR